MRYHEIIGESAVREAADAAEPNFNILAQKIYELVGFGGDEQLSFTNDEIAYLRGSLNLPYTVLYRGMAILPHKLTQKQVLQLRQLKEGMPVPKWLRKESNPYEHWTRNRDIAQKFSERWGCFSVVMSLEPRSEDLVLDVGGVRQLTELIRHSKKSYAEYSEVTSEVIVRHPPNGTVLTTSEHPGFTEYVRGKYGE